MYMEWLLSGCVRCSSLHLAPQFDSYIYIYIRYVLILIKALRVENILVQFSIGYVFFKISNI